MRMKNLILILLIFYGLVLQGITQVPEKMVFQLTLTSNQDEIVPDRPVGIRIQIKQGSEFGASVFVEAFTSETNSNGLVTLKIGGGTAILGSFAEINWTKGPFFIQTEADLSGGTNYTITGTCQLVAVPYAFHVNTADSIRESSRKRTRCSMLPWQKT